MELNAEQKRIVETKPGGHMLVKGVAGSGKTTVAVNKIPHLLNHFCYAQDRVLLVTFTRILIHYIDDIYQEIEAEQVLFPLPDKDKNVKIKTIDQIIFAFYRQQEKKEGRKPRKIIMDRSKEQYQCMSRAIYQVAEKYPDQSVVQVRNMNFLLDEIAWIKSNRYTEVEVYQQVDRRGRSKGAEEDSPQRLNKSSLNRRAIFETMLQYDRLQAHQGYIDFKTLALEVLEAMEKGIIRPRQYTHVIVDECQDFSRVQLAIVARLYRHQEQHAGITFIADTTQSIYLQSWLSHQSFKSIGFDMSGRSRILSKNYRTTAEIAAAAFSLIEQDHQIITNEFYVQPTALDRRGEYPLFRQFSRDEEELEFISREIKHRLQKTYDLKDIALMARTRGQLENARQYLARQNIYCKILNQGSKDVKDDRVNLITMHSVKGLEYKVVMMIGLNDNIIPLPATGPISAEHESLERRLLYVGMTRAREELILTCSGPPSSFIQDINPRFLRRDTNRGFSQLTPIGIENYRFKEQLDHLYGQQDKGERDAMTESFAYIDLKRNRNYILRRSLEDREMVQLYQENSDLAVPVEAWHTVHIYGKIAAGDLQEATTEKEGEFILPRELLANPRQCFIARAAGDSMINKGIESGDFIVVHRQNAADNYDLVVVTVEGEVTIKKYVRMGRDILLIPENNQYEPILKKEEEVTINGKVIGVIKPL